MELNPRTPLISAARNGSVELIQKLIDGGAYINEVDSNGITPLIHAVIEEQVEIVKILISNGANLDYTEGFRKWSPLTYASSNGNLEIVTLLIKNGAEVDFQPSQGSTPLMVAASRNHAKIVTFLIEQGGADINATERGSSRITALVHAAQNDSFEAMEILIAAKKEFIRLDREKQREANFHRFL